MRNEKEDDLLVSVEDLEFPEDSNYLTLGDRITGFHFLMKNTSIKPHSYWMEVYTSERDTGVIDTLQARQRIDLKPDESFDTPPLDILITKARYPQYKKVACTCAITDSDKKLVLRKSFTFYIDVEPEVITEYARIRLKSAKWPHDSKRVNYNESITNLQYEIENLSSSSMPLKLKVRTLWPMENNSVLDEILTQDIMLSPFQSRIVEVSEVKAVQAKYQEVEKGRVTLRCHIAATEKKRFWEKGTRLAENTISFFLNMDPDYGFFEIQEYFPGGPDQPRSEAFAIAGSRAWKFRLNITHPAYLASSDDIRRKDYMFEEMAKRTVYVLLRLDKFESLKTLAGLGKREELHDLPPDELVSKVAYFTLDRILAKYYSEA